MSDDYACAGSRKSKNDRKAKGRFAKYKRGGAQRATGIVVSNEQKKN